MNPFERSRRALLALLPAPLLAAVTAPADAATNSKTHRLSMHVDERDEEKMNLALNNAAAVLRQYQDHGETADIEIVAYGPGLHMLREDTAPPKIKERLASFTASMPQVKFSACNNTRVGMAKAEGKTPDQIPIIRAARVVPAGVVRLIELQEQGWSYVKP
ncbi:MAG TPA: DsrE family protein [Alphaproteobacteria bacterium]|nr:DsrE family protein [Alphaproteobacteria bacterium]